MSERLLLTKLYIPPLRPNLVPRPHLIERLNQGLQLGHKLTLVSAPAGFGKTTLVSKWVNSLRLDADKESQFINRIAWLSLDAGDNDPTRFLAYIVAALNQVEEIKQTIGEGAVSMLQSPQPPPIESILISLINDVATIPDRIVLVLDDYHIIVSSPVDKALAFLIEHLPPQMHLVIATRDDPDLPLGRLRASGRLAELRATDLRFSPSEAAEFLNQVMGLALSAEEISALEIRTEGWIVGLQLAALSMQGKEDVATLIKSFAGSHRFILDYLIEEVLEQQSEHVQQFLLKTSILKQLNGALCDALTGQNNSQSMLEMLESANMFIVPQDEERHWYRYHHLFSDLLRQRLRQTRLDQIPTLHHRASEWYEQNGYIDEAIEHTLRKEDFERAAYMIEKYADDIWQRGEHARLRRWLAKLPGGLLVSKPHLCIFSAWYLFAGGRQDAAEEGLQAAEMALNTTNNRTSETSTMNYDQLSRNDRMKIQGRAAVIRAYMATYRGEISEIIDHACQALEYLPKEDLTWRSSAAITLGDAHSFKGDVSVAYQAKLKAVATSKAAGDIYFVILASLKLVITMRSQGRLHQILAICRQQLQLAHENGLSQSAVVGCLLAIWGETLAELNDLDGALDKARKGVGLTEVGRDLLSLGWSYICLIRVLISMGDLAGAEEIVQKMEKAAREYDMPFWFPVQISAWQSRIWLAQNNLEAASQWVQECGLDAAGDPAYVHEMEYMQLARVLIAQGRLDEANKLLRRWLGAAEAGGRTSRVIEILMLQALSEHAQVDTDQVITTIERAFYLAEPRGFIRIFVDEGPPMARLLYDAATRGIAPDYARRLLAAFPVTEPVQTDLPKSQASDSLLVEALSDREIEVLQLIAEGLTNQAIASRLFLSQNTVKVHTRNIHGKLDVHSRMQAVAKARALGILA